MMQMWVVPREDFALSVCISVLLNALKVQSNQMNEEGMERDCMCAANFDHVST